jgi:long-subunit fatty acid transport protein
MFVNPATLSLLPGSHFHLGGHARFSRVSAALAPVDGATGQPSGAALLPDAISQTAAPQLQGALISDFGLDYVHVGFMAHNRLQVITPGKDTTDFFDPSEHGPHRYHGADWSLLQTYLTVGVAVKITRGWYVGLSTSYVFGRLRYSFVTDAALFGGATRSAEELIAIDDCLDGPCGYASDRAARAVTVRGTFSGLGFSAGIIGELHPDVRVGIGYISAILGFGGTDIPAKGDAWVRRAPAAFESASNSLAVNRDIQGRGVVQFQLPDIISVGVAWQVNRRLALDFQFRWLFLRRHDRIGVRLTGSKLREDPSVADQIAHYRGFHDAFWTQVGGQIRLTSRFSLQAALAVESKSSNSASTTVIGVAGWRIETITALIWQVSKPFALRIGYGFSWIPSVNSEQSRFAPSAMVECVDKRYDIDEPVCDIAGAGRALPSAAGRYGFMSHELGGSLTLSWR